MAITEKKHQFNLNKNTDVNIQNALSLALVEEKVS